MYRFFSDDTFQQALSFLVSQTTYIEPQVVRIKYPELNYAELVPVDTSAPEWAKSITFFSIDMVGQADWFNHMARDIPFADIMRQKHEHGIEMAAVGYRYTLEELAQAMMLPNTNLTVERAAAARRAYEEFVYNIALYGDTRKEWLGLLNNSFPAVIDVSTTWASRIIGASATNLDSVIASILSDFNMGLTNIWEASLTVEMADTVLLPLTVISLLAMTQLPHTTMNILQWLKENNLYTQQTGRPLTIRSVRGLDNAGASGNGRMITYTRDPQVLKMHIPMPHRFLGPWQSGPIIYDIPGIFRLAGLEIRRPGALRYIDGVS